MNNGQPQVFMGRQSQNINTQDRLGTQQQPQGGQTNSLQNSPLGQLMAMSNNVTKQMANPANGQSLYTVSNRNSSYSHLISMEDNMAEEQIKNDALNQAGYIAANIWNQVARRLQNNAYYKIHMGARERFKSPKRGLPHDPTLTSFIAEIDANQQLYQLILANVSIMFTAEMARQIIMGNEQLRHDRSITDDIYYRCTIDALNMQFFHYLGTHPEGSSIFHNAAPILRDVLIASEDKIYNMCLDRFTFVNGQCPWRNGMIAELNQRASQPNYLADMGSAMDLGFGGNFYEKAALPGYQAPTAVYANQTDPNMESWIAQRAAQFSTEKQSRPFVAEDVGLTTVYGSHPQLLEDLRDLKTNNRHMFDMTMFAKNIPGTEWYVVRDRDMQEIVRTFLMDDGTPFRFRDTRSVGAFPVYRFNWSEGTFNFRLVKHNLKDFDLMESLISDPSKLLPYMYEEDGIQRHSFDPVVMETNKFMTDGIVLPVGELKELEKEPQILVGSKPMKANMGNDALVNRMDVLTQTYDPKNKLDAFVMPTVIAREWQMEPNVDMARFYQQFEPMVQGNTIGATETILVIRNLRRAYQSCESQEFTDFIRPYITNLVNRYLVEVAGYAETKKESQEAVDRILYMRSSDIFEDLEDWCEWLKENDLQTLRAFNDYQTNTFMRMGIEILCSAEQVKAEYTEKYGKDEDQVLAAAMIKSGEKAVIIRRDSVFFNLRKQPAPHNTEMFTVQKSVNPELFAIINNALKITDKHFDHDPQVLVKFDCDEYNKVYVVSRSYLDKANVFNVRPMSNDQNYCHPWPVTA